MAMILTNGRVTKRLIKKFAIPATIITILFAVSLLISDYELRNLSPFKNGALSGLSETKKLKTNPQAAPEFWKTIFNIFEENKLSYSDEELREKIRYVDKKDQIKGTLTKEALLSRAVIDETFIQELGSKHKKVLDSLPDELPKSLYNPGTTGVVIVGGGRFSWLAYLALISLRETGSTLPVEVMMPAYADTNDESLFCAKLKELNAECVTIPEKLGDEVNENGKYENYQLKSLAIVTSTFQNVLLLDSDNIPMQNPEQVFESDLFKEYGLITWPDYWTRTMSPIFYEVAGVKVNENKRVRKGRYELNPDTNAQTSSDSSKDKKIPYHDLEGTVPDVSTESGQLIINKATHAKTLLLSLYYNVNGPLIFYKLLSQGTPGEGDKDTFLTAAVVTNQKFYQVKSTIHTYGYFDGKGDFHGVAMGQKNPVEDFHIFKTRLQQPLQKTDMPLSKQIEYVDKLHGQYFDSHKFADLFMLHCNFPKLDPTDLMQKEEIYDSDKNQLKHRIFPRIDVARYSYPDQTTVRYYDFEYHQWTLIKDFICNNSNLFVFLKDKDHKKLCSFATNQMKLLKPDSK